jgi:MFS family permease
MTDDGLVASLDRYRRHQRVAGALFWLPTVFLYLIDQHGLEVALRVQAVYYAAVVLLEVPSGWLSDRLGRVGTLRLVAVWWIVAHMLFVVAPGSIGLPGIVVAQAFLAAGYAFLSGTDVTYHFDTLEALGRADEFDHREAASRRGLLEVTALTAVVGGAAGSVDLRLPFALSLVAAVGQLALAWRLVEPAGQSTTGGRAQGDRWSGLGRDLLITVGHLRHGPLAWLGLYVVAQVVVVHLVADLTGPYLAEVLGPGLGAPDQASLATGVVAAAVALVGAASVQSLPWLVRRFGLAVTLLGLAVVPAALLVAMASVAAVWVVPFLALRGVQGSVVSVVVPPVVGGHVEQRRRATFLSMTSLGGRLGYGAALLALAAAGGSALGPSMTVAAGASLALLAVVLVGYLILARGRIQLTHDHEHQHLAMAHDHLHSHDGGPGDGHHDHRHDPPFVGDHRHEHHHEAVRHRHCHTADLHHRHAHGGEAEDH